MVSHKVEFIVHYWWLISFSSSSFLTKCQWEYDEKLVQFKTSCYWDRTINYITVHHQTTYATLLTDWGFFSRNSLTVLRAIWAAPSGGKPAYKVRLLKTQHYKGNIKQNDTLFLYSKLTINTCWDAWKGLQHTKHSSSSDDVQCCYCKLLPRVRKFPNAIDSLGILSTHILTAACPTALLDIINIHTGQRHVAYFNFYIYVLYLVKCKVPKSRYHYSWS